MEYTQCSRRSVLNAVPRSGTVHYAKLDMSTKAKLQATSDRLTSLYESVPDEFQHVKLNLIQSIASIDEAILELDEQAQSPDWFLAVWEIAQYVGTCMIVSAYIYRSARTGAGTVLTQAIGYGLDGSRLVIKEMLSGKRFVSKWANKNFNIKNPTR